MSNLTQKLDKPTNFKLYSIILVVALLAGVVSGFVLAYSHPTKTIATTPPASQTALQKAGADTKTFKDFDQGTIQKKPDGDDYSEGTHLLIRANNATPVALTSSVLDLNQYVGKKVKVYGETQKALKQGWLMDVGKVEVQ
jgi:hypothetical protein